MGERADWMASVGQVLRIAQAYAGEAADDEPGRPSRALEGYLRCVRRSGDDSLPGIAASQIHDLLDADWNEPDVVDVVGHLFLPTPDDGRSRRDWLGVVAELLEARAEGQPAPPDAPPVTAFEWRTSYPDLAQVIGGSFHNDALAIHGSYDAALAEDLASRTPFQLARAIGQLEEIIAGDLDEATLRRGIHALGAGLLPPGGITHREWLAAVGAALRKTLAS
jgi:hypothetical protein